MPEQFTRPGPVDFAVRQVDFHITYPDGQDKF